MITLYVKKMMDDWKDTRMSKTETLRVGTGRQAMRLIKDVEPLEVVTYQGESEDFDRGVKFILEKLDSLPTIDPEELRHKGRWVRVEDDVCYWYECSECGEKPAQRYKYDFFSDFCPNCGAKMEGGEG